MRNPKIGLLPLYVELYDISTPQVRPQINAFHRQVSERLRAVGLDVVDVPVCRLAGEFASAIETFEVADVDAIVTLHLAYSPSMESEKALAATKLPLIILDTTPDYTYDQTTDMSALMYNHGIHGVQDMCNLLQRNGKRYKIFAGHMDHSDVLTRVAGAARAAMAAHELGNARVGLIGEPFAGMGDFRVPFEALKQDLGIETVQYDFDKGASRVAAVTQADIDAEYAADQARFEFSADLSRETYDRTARTCLAVRRWAEEERLTGFSINFLETDKPGLPVMPFTECCTAMERGLGYAGEGDVLTAALTGALLQAYPETTFTEMFCPDWEHGSVFLSHMGEYNYAIADGKPLLLEKPFPYTPAENPTVAIRSMKGGRCVFLNLAPFGDGRYGLTLASGEMLPIKGENKMGGEVNGWFKPDVPLASFLEQFSQAGATHHSVLVYGDVLEQLQTLAEFLPVTLRTIV